MRITQIWGIIVSTGGRPRDVYQLELSTARLSTYGYSESGDGMRDKTSLSSTTQLGTGYESTIFC